MDSGLFRLLDAGRYMELDGLTAKHLYRFLAVAFEKTDMVIVDARDLATKHLGILSLPHYFSRLMQTLEPAFDQLVQIGVVGSYHVVEAENWRLALKRHPNYVPERKALLEQSPGALAKLSREHCLDLFEKAGLPAASVQAYCDAAQSAPQFYALRRASHVLLAFKDEQVLPHVGSSFIRRALEDGAWTPAGQEQLDWCEIAVEVCRQKKAQGQKLSNAAGLIVKLVKDPEARAKLVTADAAQSMRALFRSRERAYLQQVDYEVERDFILEYEEFRQRLGASLFQDMSSVAQNAARKRQLESLGEQDRFDKMTSQERDAELEQMVIAEIGRKESPAYEKWRLRKQAAQALLPFSDPNEAMPAPLFS
jgi:hypothetical protein